MPKAKLISPPPTPIHADAHRATLAGFELLPYSTTTTPFQALSSYLSASTRSQALIAEGTNARHVRGFAL